MDWHRYIRFLTISAVIFGLALYAFILVLDPYQNVPFSPTLSRAPVSSNQRFAYPALARDPRFDGLILGTSTARLIDPARISQAIGAELANLAMNSATAYEQERMLDVFHRHHPQMKFLILGVDETWCNRAERIERYTFRAFPEWMYDDNRFNDLVYLFNDKALENSVRMLEFLVGERTPKYRHDGYADFTADFGRYDPDVVTTRLFKGPAVEIQDAEILPTRTHSDWNFPLLGTLARVIERMPATARIVLLFPPLHAHYLVRRAELLSECKGRIETLAAADNRTRILDYMFVSNLTRDSSNYWDPVHFTAPVARLLEKDIGAVLLGHQPPSSIARRLAEESPNKTTRLDE
jgi:hypothetical protein